MSNFQVVTKRKTKKSNKDTGVNGISDRVNQISIDIEHSEFYTNSLGLIVGCIKQMRAWKQQIEASSMKRGNIFTLKDLTIESAEGLTPETSEPSTAPQLGIKDDTDTAASQALGSDSVDSIVCYGLGNFADCYIARYQLAYLLALRQKLQVPLSQCYAYDPKFTSEESDCLRKYGFTVLQENEEGKRGCNGMVTLFYMPHCGKALYNNLLWRNWGPDLANLVVIGNSFSRMIDSTPSRLLKKTAEYVTKIQPFTQEVGLPVTDRYSDVFNDTAIHTFLCQPKQEVAKELWEDREEPHYDDDDDAEIIFNK